MNPGYSHVYDWKIEKMSNTGELLFTDDDNDPLDDENFFPNAPCRYLPPKRRTGRINMGGRTRFHRREGGSVIEHRPPQHHQMLRRTSSADTDKHLLIGNEDISFGRSKDKSASELSINQRTKRPPSEISSHGFLSDTEFFLDILRIILADGEYRLRDILG
jgi:hypothetical protein